nr:hypothetical protein [Tanacetum cinerariifolium]
MYYPRFTKVIIHHFMSKDLSISRRNKVNWHYVRDDIIFLTIKVVSRHQNTEQYGTMLPIDLTNEEIRNTKAYKEYYASATGEAAPKLKASAKRKRSGLDTSITLPTAITTPTTTVSVTPRLTTSAKDKQPAKAKSPSDPSKIARTEAQQPKIVLRRSRHETHISQLGGSDTDKGTDTDAQEKNRDDDENDESYDREENDDDDKDGDERDDDDVNDEEEIANTDEQDDAERSGDDDKETKSDEESDGDETKEEESFDPIPRTSKDSEDDGNGEEDHGLKISVEERLNEEEEADELYRDSIFATASSPVAPLQTSTPIMTPSTIATITTASQAPIPPTSIPSEVLQNLPTFDSVFCFDERLKSLEASFSEYRQTNPFAEAVSNILGIVHQYMHQQMNEAVKSQVKEQVLKILPRIEQSVNAQLEAEVLTRSSHSSRTSYAVAADLSEMELKKILIEKMEGNKSIQCSDEQRTLYKALVEAYEADKIILDTYGECVILKRRRDDDDDDQGKEPCAGLDRGSKRQREGKEPESASAPLEPATRSTGRSTIGSKSRQASESESAFAEETVHTTSHPSHLVFETGAEDQPIVQSSQHPEWFSQPKKPPTLDRD